MLEAYSLNVTTLAGGMIPFNNITLKKGCTAELSSPATVQLNKCGIYMIEVDASAAASATIQLYLNGVAQPQAQSTGTSPSFTTLVQATDNNSKCCPCSAPTNVSVISTTASTYADVNIVVTKVV